MADLELKESYLRAAAKLLIDAASIIRANRSMPMLQADTYTGIGPIIGSFMEVCGVAAESLSDSAGEAAVSVAAIMSAATELEAEINSALGPGFAS